jgi:hypothetical protein
MKLNGKDICNSVAHYGQEAGYIASGEVAPKNTTEWATISDMDLCNILTPVKKGDKLSIVATCKCFLCMGYSISITIKDIK